MKQEVWRGKGPIKSVYVLKTPAGSHVVAYDKEGLPLPRYEGKLGLVKDRVLADAPFNTEYHTSSWGHGNFTRITREQFKQYHDEED